MNEKPVKFEGPLHIAIQEHFALAREKSNEIDQNEKLVELKTLLYVAMQDYCNFVRRTSPAIDQAAPGMLLYADQTGTVTSCHVPPPVRTDVMRNRWVMDVRLHLRQERAVRYIHATLGWERQDSEPSTSPDKVEVMILAGGDDEGNLVCLPRKLIRSAEGRVIRAQDEDQIDFTTVGERKKLGQPLGRFENLLAAG